MGTCCEGFGKHWIVFSFVQRFTWLTQRRPQGKKNVCLSITFVDHVKTNNISSKFSTNILLYLRNAATENHSYYATKLYATNVRFIRWASLLQVLNEMEQLKHRDSDSFCDRNMNCFYQILHEVASYYLHDRSLLMSRHNIIFTFSLYLFNSMGT